MIYLFGGFAATWILLFAYMAWVQGRVRRLRQEVQLLKESLRLDA